MSTYDNASWHSGGDFPKSSPPEYGGTHIALFLRWCFLKGWASPFHTAEHGREVEAVKRGSLSATQFLFEHCDGRLTDEDLTNEGNRFASSYYGDDGSYLQDYAETFGDLMYEAPESQHDFTRFCAMVDARYAAVTAPAKGRPWWRFWQR